MPQMHDTTDAQRRQKIKEDSMEPAVKRIFEQ